MLTITATATITVPARVWPAFLRALQTFRKERLKPWPDRYVTTTGELAFRTFIWVALMDATPGLKRFLTELLAELPRDFSGELDFRKAAR